MTNRLYSITANRHGDIWCQTYDSRIYLFDSRREKFIDILQPIETAHKTNYTIHQIYVLPKGITWIVSDHGAFRVDEEAFREKRDSSIVFYSPINKKNIQTRYLPESRTNKFAFCFIIVFLNLWKQN